jgi:hypothetical protein
MSTVNPGFGVLFYVIMGIYLLIIIGVVLFAISHIRHLSKIANEITGLRTAIADRFSPEGLAPAAAPKESTVDLAALRLQACERFTLMLERISVPNLLLRQSPDPELTTREYTAQLLLSIRQEVEYNITQQIYVSDSLWSIITQARDNVSMLIAQAAEGAESSAQVASRLRNMSSRQAENPIALAQGAIRREAASVLTD